MSEAARCQSLEDELKLLKEDLYLEKASNEDLKAELRELKRHNASLTQERSQTYKTINSMGSQKEFLQEDQGNPGNWGLKEIFFSIQGKPLTIFSSPGLRTRRSTVMFLSFLLFYLSDFCLKMTGMLCLIYTK